MSCFILVEFECCNLLTVCFLSINTVEGVSGKRGTFAILDFLFCKIRTACFNQVNNVVTK